MSYTMLIVLTIIGWGIGSVCYKIANDNMHPLMVTSLVTGMYVLATPLFFYFAKFPKTINSTGLLFTILGGLIMGIGSLAYYFALKKGDAGEVTTVTSLYPALTLILSCLFLQEAMTLRKGIGISFALIAFIILSKK